MASMLETPSRIWRRIEAEGSQDMPSLPSVPGFNDSAEISISSDDPSLNRGGYEQEDEPSFGRMNSPIHSTPAASHHASTIRATSSTSSTTRFANTLVRSGRSSLAHSSVSRALISRQSYPDSFEISAIPSLPEEDTGRRSDGSSGELDNDLIGSRESAPEEYASDIQKLDTNGEANFDVSLTDALESISSPYQSEPDRGRTPKERSYIDYEVSLKSSPKATPFSSKYRHVSLRRPMLERTRTPSLSRTSLSPASSPSNSTPRSGRSLAMDRSTSVSPIQGLLVPLPPSNAGSPAPHSPGPDISSGTSEPNTSTNTQSMDITDADDSPIRQLAESSLENEEGKYASVTGSVTREESTSEHTFSTDDGPTPYAVKNNGNSRSLEGLASAFSSPAASMATPTPAFPRPRTRFNIPQDGSSDESHETQGEVHGVNDEDLSSEEPMTPQTRRRSFFLSVINSTARPRMKFPTPHPRDRILPDTPSTVDVSPLPVSRAVVQNTPIAFQSAFTGATPRPRFNPGSRLSHPLAQARTFNSSSSASETEAGEETDGTARAEHNENNNEHVSWTTPAPSASVAHLSPYDEAALNGASFVSTASSHDLTTHPRANTSFDPAMGFGGNAPGHGVGRFNANKLNTYLHGLNRKLQEENEALMERNRILEEAQGKSNSSSVPPTPVTAAMGSRRQSGGSRRLSAVSNLGDLPEEANETWMEEKAELEEMVETFKNETEQYMKEKEEVERALEQEIQERARDKDRWKERMSEVQKGVEQIVRDLENKLHATEEDAHNVEKAGLEQVTELEKKLTEIQAQRDDVAARAEKAESALANNQDLGGELRNANNRVSNLMSDLRNANSQIKELEGELIRSEEFVDGLEHDLAEQKNILADLRKALEAKDRQIEAQRAEVHHLEQAHQKTEETLNATKEHMVKIEEDASTAVEQVEALEEELEATKDSVKHLKMVAVDRKAQNEDLAKEAERAVELARQMEEALEAAEKKMAEDEDELAAMKGKLIALEREKERQKDLSTTSIDHSRLASDTAAQAAAHEAEIESLEQELDNATKEIARLNTVLTQSPARRAVDKAKDAKIDMLEQENEALSERIKALRMTMNDFNSPSKLINNSGISPMHRRALSMSIRAPKTPGGPLRDMSWLNNTTADPISGSPLVAEISRLQRELDRANESIDDKLDKLEDAGLGVVGLTKKLEDASFKIRSLEDHIARLSRREERRLRRLRQTRCQKCLTRVDVRSIIHLSEDESLFEAGNDNLPSEPPTPPTKTSDALRANLRTVNSQLQETKKQWEDEKRKLLGEKAVLQDAASRLNAEAQDAKAEASKASEAQKVNGRIRQDIQGDLEKARHIITELERDLKAERSRLRAMTTEQSRVNREKEQIFVQLQRTETDMEDVRTQLQTCKKENRELENELRVNANIEQRARLLEIKVAENAETMEQLRDERTLLVADHKKLQQRYSEISEHANQLLDNEAASRKTHDKHRHELDLHLNEIEDLRKALSDRSGELHRVEAEKHRIAAERSDVAQTVALLEADLKRVRENAEAFGRDLKELRLEKERLEKKHREEQTKADRTKKQTQTQIRLLTEQLEGQRSKTLKAREEMENHVCAMDDHQVSTLKLQHNKEAKGLIVQIRYLKAKFTRESMLRFDLAYQKHYLLILLNKFEKSEQTISAAIARIGFPVATSSAPKKRKMKTIIQSIIFLTRMKRATEEWRKQTASRQAITAALEDVHQRRAAALTKS
ncbi:hypothetical protein J3R30DRAFT_633332 [Lentinula aciculospora]|uniref:Pericentrin/AKAP-450 centrosomal targeting domain-containing protein n=1 Tax=Lentinula aciculospora TaxID=153920 RepID=A0A9W9DKM4_9AGAR|nr:hypothetical protein J3R30DRAFT_633332 [Lentinula aciculospora]